MLDGAWTVDRHRDCLWQLTLLHATVSQATGTDLRAVPSLQSQHTHTFVARSVALELEPAQSPLAYQVVAFRAAC